MESHKSFLDSKTHDVINLVASLVGILGFLTGISNLPSLISGNKEELVSWFGSQISYWLSIPVFVFTVFFVYGLYFLIIVQIYKWLYLHDAVWWTFSFFEFLNLAIKERGALGKLETTLVSVLFFTMIGLALGGFIFQAFFGLEFWSELRINLQTRINFIVITVITGIFLSSLCGLAQKTASHQAWLVRQKKG